MGMHKARGQRGVVRSRLPLAGLFLSVPQRLLPFLNPFSVLMCYCALMLMCWRDAVLMVWLREVPGSLVHALLGALSALGVSTLLREFPITSCIKYTRAQPNWHPLNQRSDHLRSRTHTCLPARRKASSGVEVRARLGAGVQQHPSEGETHVSATQHERGSREDA